MASNEKPHSGGGGSGQPDEPEVQAERKRRSVPAILLRVVWVFLSSLVVLILLILLLLQSNWGAQLGGRVLLGLLDPFNEAVLRIDRVGGTFLTGLDLEGVRLVKKSEGEQEETLVSMDTLRMRYSLRGLLRRRLSFSEIYISNPSVVMTQQADSSWDLINILPIPEEVDTTAQAFVLEMQNVTVEGGRFAAHYYAPGRDSVFSIYDANTRIREVEIEDGVDLAVDTLWMTLRPPGADGPVDARASGSLMDGHLALNQLRLLSESSNLVASGVLNLANDEVGEIHDIDFELDADPIAFRDIRPFLPTLDPDRTARIDARFGGTSSLIFTRVAADFDDGSSIFIEGDVSPVADGPVEYRLMAEIRRFDPAIIGGGEQGNVRLNGDVRADLEGASLDVLEGTLRAVVFDSQFGEYAPERTVLDARFSQGTAALELTGGLRGASFSTTGTLRPFSETIAYDLRGRVEDLDFYRFTDSDGGSDVAGNFRLQGRGIDRHADLSLNLFLDPSTVNDYAINGGQLDIRFRDEMISGSTRLATEDGFLALQGQLELDDPMRYRITRGYVENFDLASLMGQPRRSSLTGSISGTGRGADAATMVLNGDIRLEPSFYGDITINHAAGRVVLNQGLVRVDAEADLEGGSFDVEGIVRPFRNVPTFQIAEASFRNVDIGRLTGSPDQQTDLTGTLEAAGRGFDIETMSLDGNLRLAPSQINQQMITGANAAVSLRGGSVRFDGDVATPEGRAQLVGSMQPFLDRPAYAIESGTFSGLDIGAFLNEPDWRTRLTGTIQLEGQGFEPQTMVVEGRLELEDSAVNRERIDRAIIEGSVRNGFAQLRTEADLSDGFLRADARGRLFDERPTYEAEGSLLNFDPARLLRADTLDSRLTGSFEISGTGFDPETMSAEGFVVIDNSRYDRIEVQTARASLVMFDGLLQVDSVRVRSNVLDVTGAGQLALFDTTYASDFAFVADIRDLDPLRPFLELDELAVDEGHIEGRVYGQPGRIQFDASASLTSFVYDDLRVAGFRGEIAGELLPGLELRMAETQGEVDFLSSGDFSIQSGVFNISIDQQDVVFFAEATVDAEREVRLAGRADLSPEARSATLERLDLRLGRDRWELLQEATITYGEEIRVGNLLLYSGDQQIAVDGVIDPDGEQNLVMTVENFRIDAVTDLIGFEGLGGVVSGFVDLTGAAEAPRLTGQLEADLTSDGRDVGEMDLELNYEDLALAIDAVLTHDDGSRLTATGTLPMDLRLVELAPEETIPGVAVRAQEQQLEGEVDLTIVSENFSVNWLMPFMDRETVDRLEGRLVGTVQVGGTFGNPQLSGDVTLREGVVTLPTIGVTLRNAEADATMRENRVDIARAVAQSGSGSIEATGSINLTSLTNYEYNLQANADGFLASNTDEYRIVADGNFRLTGTARSPVLDGNVTVVSGDIWLTEETTAEPVELTQEDLRMLEQRFGVRPGEVDTTVFDFFDALTMNLAVRMERNTWLRSRQNPNMDVQFTGRLDVSKEPMADMLVFGTIEVIPERSRIRQFGRVFDITTGILQFNGPISDMLLDLEAEYHVRARDSREDQVVIVLGVSGRLDSLDLDLDSRNPPGLDMADIVSYIATGRPASEGFQLGGSGGAAEAIGELGTAAFLTQVTGWVEGVAGEELGLDVIEIQQDGLLGTRITAGKYVTRRLYVAVSEPIAFGTDEEALGYREEFARRITLEYEVTNWLLTRLVRDGSNLRFNLLWEYSY